jgi:hypothetical protein
MSTENQPEWEKDFDEKFVAAKYERFNHDILSMSANAKDIKAFIHSFALTLLDEIGLEEKSYAHYERDCEHCGYSQAKADLDTKISAIKQKYGL